MVNLEKEVTIVRVDLLLEGLEEDVAEAHPPEMGLEQSHQVQLIAVTWLRHMEAFQLDKVAAAYAELLVDGEGLEFVNSISILLF